MFAAKENALYARASKNWVLVRANASGMATRKAAELFPTEPSNCACVYYTWAQQSARVDGAERPTNEL